MTLHNMLTVFTSVRLNGGTLMVQYRSVQQHLDDIVFSSRALLLLLAAAASIAAAAATHTGRLIMQL